MKYLAIFMAACLALGSVLVAAFMIRNQALELRAYADCRDTLGRWDSSAHRCIDVTEER